MPAGCRSRAELQSARDWYEACAEGLGVEFLNSLDSCLSAVSHNPASYPVVHGKVRRAPFRRFPYSLIYRIESDGILVIACHHHRQRPERWHERLGQ
ncbi:type II toxin-antitoxin system RelE/ParE family toxin [Pseudomonas sp. GCM10022186]|uniref:type II toxin-antitoxin system RelE/ParE family toxin n=1 Tax=Pseudomonas sp. GCM10022186 TaxID=3252650 RepID=UPI003620CA4D